MNSSCTNGRIVGVDIGAVNFIRVLKAAGNAQCTSVVDELPLAFCLQVSATNNNQRSNP